MEDEDEIRPHYITFKIPIFLKDISDYFRKIDLIQFGEFNINVQLIDGIFVTSREGCSYNIKNAYLHTEELKLTDGDNIKYLKMLDDKFTKKINFMENHTLIFDGKLKEINEDFAINNIRNSDSVYIYGILNTKKTGLNNDLPSVKFENLYLNIDNIRFENPIPNDISPYNIFKYKSNHSDNFIINLQDSNQPGSYWMALKRVNNTIFVFDSFGIGYIPVGIFKVFKNLKIITNIYRIQDISSNLCGMFCVLFILYDIKSKNGFIKFLTLFNSNDFLEMN